MDEMGLYVESNRHTVTQPVTIIKEYPKILYAADGITKIVSKSIWEITLYTVNGTVKSYTNHHIVDYRI